MIVFASVVETRSFTDAAEVLGLSKSAVSKTIAALEVRLGARLLQRTTRRMEVTEVGMAWYHYCARIVSEVKSANLFIRQYHEEPTGSLRIVAPVSYGSQCVMPVVNRFIATNLHVTVDVDLTDRPVNLEGDNTDIALIITRENPAHPHSLFMSEISWGLYAAPGYLQHHPVITQPADLARHDFLLFRGPAHTPSLPLRKDKKRHTIPVHSRLRANNSTALINSAIAESGIAYLPDYIAYDALQRGTLVQVLAEWEMESFSVFLLYRQESFTSPRVRLFIDALQQAISPPQRGEAPAQRSG